MTDLQIAINSLKATNSTHCNCAVCQRINDALETLSRLEAQQDEVPQNAKELIGKLDEEHIKRIHELFDWKGNPEYHVTESMAENNHSAWIDYAAQEIERYVQTRIASQPKTIPSKLVEGLISPIAQYLQHHDNFIRRRECNEVAEHFGFTIEEE